MSKSYWIGSHRCNNYVQTLAYWISIGLLGVIGQYVLMKEQNTGYRKVKNIATDSLVSDPVNIEWVHALGVSVEIELKMDWQGCKKFNIFKPYTYSVGEINTKLKLC